MPKSIEPKLTWKVCYKAKPEYNGVFNIPEAPGIHGEFPTLKLAKEGVESCKRWFNLERREKKIQRDSKVHVEEEVRFHDNVIVWIEQYKDGFYEGNVECEEKPEPKPSSSTESGAKSKRTTSTVAV